MSDKDEFEHWSGLPREALNAARELDEAIQEFGNGWHDNCDEQKDYSRLLQARITFARFARKKQIFLPAGEYECTSLAERFAHLRKENAELREIIRDAVGPTVAWASEWQTRNSAADLYPQHQELIDRMIAASQSTSSRE